MKIGYLHIGLPEHGVCRYGRLLAKEAQKRSDLMVIEYEVILTKDKKQNRKILIDAAKKLSEADVVHFQSSCLSNKTLWGTGWDQLNNLQAFLDNCLSPLVVTLHDTFVKPYNLASIFQDISLKFTNKKPHLNKDARMGLFGLGSLSLNQITSKSQLIFVFNEQEYQLMQGHCNQRKLKILPHFIEEKSINISKIEARKALGLHDIKVLTIQGFIYRGKGHELLINAMPELVSDVKVIFAGGTSIGGTNDIVNDLITLAKQNKVDERLQITGYLSDKDLEMYLMATDIAICPFSRISASGSLSSWLSVGCPIIASDLPQISEYNKLELNAIKTFSPYTPGALAKAINKWLTNYSNDQTLPFTNLQQKLSISVIFEQHLLYYRSLSS
jgi:glycosyltransferase involved in cell wall biosynthesis